MKRLVTTLALASIFISIYGQSRIVLATEHVAEKQLAGTSIWDNARRSPGSEQQRVVSNIVLDPALYDATITADSNGDFIDNYFVNLNTNYEDNDSFRRFAMTWATQIFDTLLDINTLSGYPYSITPVHLDSADIWISHTHNAGTPPDTIIFTVYQHQGPLGIQVDFSTPGEPLANTVLYSDTVITSTSLSPANQFSLYTIYPDIEITGNKKFVIGVHFYGDTTNEFGLRVGFADRCGEACVAYPSINVDDLVYRMVHWQHPPAMAAQDLTGVWSNFSFTLAYDCNEDNDYPQRDGCEYTFMQNFLMTAYVTTDPALYAYATPDTSICPGNTVNLTISPVGGVGPYTVTWDPQTGLTDPFSAVTDATVNETTPYTATITDSDTSGGSPNVITRTITITVNGIEIEAGANQTINCGQTATLVAVPSGVLTNSTYAWSNGKNTLNNTVTEAGTYTITATNIYGCSKTDFVSVSFPGVTQALSFTTSAPNNISCIGNQITFTNTSSSLGAGWNWNWNFGDGSQNTAESPTYAYTAIGDYTVYLSAYSLSGTDSCKFTRVPKALKINATCPVGIEDLSLENKIELYPNPTEGMFTVNFRDLGSISGTLGIYDIRGALIAEEPVSVSATNSQRVFNISNASDGIYFVKIQLGNDVLMKKLTLSR